MRGKRRTKKEKENIVRSLKPYFELGYSLNKACILAKIPTSTANDIIRENEELRIEMEASQNLISVEARKVIAKQIKKGDVSLSKWWLEKVDLPNNEKEKEKEMTYKLSECEDKELEELEELFFGETT